MKLLKGASIQRQQNTKIVPLPDENAIIDVKFTARQIIEKSDGFYITYIQFIGWTILALIVGFLLR